MEADKQKNPIISIALCTYKRPDFLPTCLQSLMTQPDAPDYEIIVVDNDQYAGSRLIFEQMDALQKPDNLLKMTYAVEPVQGIAHARNLALSMCRGRYIAFVDDDERVPSDWLRFHMQILIENHAGATVGRLISDFAPEFPRWQYRLFEHPGFKDAQPVPAKYCVVNNTLLDTHAIDRRDLIFDPETTKVGFDDTELMDRLVARGLKVVWAEKAPVKETVPVDRSRLRWHLVRYYRGGWGWSWMWQKRLGKTRALLLTLIWVIPALLKGMLGSLKYGCPRTVVLSWLRVFASQLGKLGFFAGIRVLEYGG